MEKKEIIYGRNPVLEFIKQMNSGDAVLYISITAHGKIINTIVKYAKEKRINIEFCNKESLHKLCKSGSSSKHQGVVLELATSGENIRGVMRLEDFLETARGKRGVIVLLDQLTDPHNVGSIIRSAEALGCAGLILTKAHSAGITSAIAKTSAGATAYLPLYTVPNAASFLENVKKIGYWIIGTSGKGSIDPGKLKELRPAVIIIGNEGEGMRRLTEEKCDYIVKIPLKGRIPSLNASVAAGIILFEALKE